MIRYLMFALLAAPAMAAPPVVSFGLDRINIRADAEGVCTVTGYMLPESSAAILCSLGHAERAPIIAQVETGSLDVQGWVLRATGGTALVALRNTSTAPAGLFSTRIVLGRMAPATPLARPDVLMESCFIQSIRDHQDPWFCKDFASAAAAAEAAAKTEAPAAATAGAE